MRIAFVVSEAVPFAKTGGLADVCGSLPLALEKLGHEVIMIMPYYRGVGVQKAFNDRARITTIGRDIKVYFIVNKEFFGRPDIYGDANGDYKDSLDRFSFFCHQTLALIKELGKPVDILHCHDWPTGLLPVLLKENYRADQFFAKTRSVMTIHNLAYQGVFSKEELPKLGVDEGLFNQRQIEFFGKINLIKAGIVFSDQVTTVSPQYASEILTMGLGCGLDGVLHDKKGEFVGILNGLNYDQWDPETDEFIDPKYSAGDWSFRRGHKARLQENFGLSTYAEIPVFGFVGRLCSQKGLDLVESAFDGLMQRPIQLVFLGVGEAHYQKLLQKLAKKCPQQCGVQIKYDENIAHMVYAGSDFFLMPSVYEPCGLSQMIALRYGAIPVASYVGGLVDTLVDLNSNRSKGNSLLMSTYSVSGFLEAIDRAVGVYHQKERMHSLIAHAMACRWTWEESAKHYAECYQDCLSS
jgi:starch synthase